MKPIKEAIEEATATGKRLLDENPSITSIAFRYEGFTVEEMNQYTAENQEQEPTYSESLHRFSFCVVEVVQSSGIYIHLHSKQVKAKIVYE